jgi:two-component system chemotaxis sensor kinase CheA
VSELDRLRAEFLAETEETLEQFQQDVNRLGDGAEHDPDVLDRAFRTAHSLKGVCGMFGLAEMTSVSHALENVFDALRAERTELTAELLDLLFQGIDTLHEVLARETGRAVNGDALPPEELIARVDAALAHTVREPEGLAADDPLPAVLRLMSPSERESVRAAVGARRRVAIVEAMFPEEGFEDPFRALLDSIRSWGSVHGTVSDPPADGSFRLRCVVSGTEELFPLLKAVGPHRAEVIPCDAERAFPEPAPAAPPSLAAAPGVPPESAPQPARAPSAAAREGTLRIRVERVDRLLSELGDLIHAKMSLDAAAAAVLDLTPDRLKRTEFNQSLRNLDRRIRMLQENILRVRMVGLRTLFQKLERTVREACRVTGKQARLVTRGEDVELDKSIVEALTEPLVHLVRNAVDHGLEDRATRVRAGKDGVGTVFVSASTDGGRTTLEVGDDGGGLDFERILLKARKVGLVKADDTPPHAVLRDLVFRAGFTVRDEAGELSGRGVGLDAVREAVADLGGVLALEERSVGTLVRMRIPTTLAVAQALRVEAAGRPYFLPLTSVARVIQVAPRDLDAADEEAVLVLDGRAVPVRSLARLLGAEEPATGGPARRPAVVLGLAGRRLVLLVDRLGSQREIVVRSLGRALPPIPGVAGSTELEDGRTVLILDPAALFDPDPPVPAEARS